MQIRLFLPMIFSMLAGFQANAQEPESRQLAVSFEKHVAILASDSLEGRGLGTEGKDKAVKYIAAEFSSFGLEPYNSDGYFQHFDLRISLVNLTGTNVVGFLPGTDPVLKNEYILIGAHYDHLGYSIKESPRKVFHGADDNASGVAMVIELARYFSAHRDLLKRSLVFVAFDAEESGLIGSDKFLERNTRFGVKDLKVMFSLDMVGMLSANNGLGMKGLGALADGEGMAEPIAKARGFSLKNTSSETESGTDTWPFGQQGIPAIHAFTGKNSPYHKVEDTYDKLDYPGMAKISFFFRDFIAELSAAKELNPSRNLATSTIKVGRRFEAGVIAGIGSSHQQYPDEFYKAKSEVAFNAGVFARVNVLWRVAIQPEVLYQTDGSKTADGIFRRHSLTVPVNIQLFLLGGPGEPVRFFPFAGGYFSWSFAGKNGGEKLDFKDVYNDQEWGANIGLGLDVYQWMVKCTWQYGLTNLMKDQQKEIHSRMWYFSMGYKF